MSEQHATAQKVAKTGDTITAIVWGGIALVVLLAVIAAAFMVIWDVITS